MARRRSCFSCGELQGGSGAFCNSCGKPLDVPDLEFLSTDSAATTGNDVVMATGGGKSRSAVAIVAVLAALGAVAAFSGKSTTATAKSTTTAVGRASSTTISTVLASTTTTTDAPTTTTDAPTTTTDAAAARAREMGRTQPRTVTTPILPEKTGTKLLLIGLTMVGSGQRGNAIVDLDSGLVTPYAADRVDDQSIVQNYGSGLLVTNMSYGGIRFSNWQPTGPAGSVTALAENSDGFNPSNTLAGDVFWSMARNPLVPQGNVARLVGYDVRDGRKVAEAAMPESAQLIGSDAENHPVVVDYGSGTYSFDPANQKFTRITTNVAFAIRGDLRVERACTEHLVCGSVLLNGSGPPRSVPDLEFFTGPMSLSPTGETLLQTSYRGGGGPTLEAIDLIAGTRQTLGLNADIYPLQLSWSADGRWLFGLSGGVLSAWKVGTSETLQLAFDGDPMRVAAFGVFPS